MKQAQVNGRPWMLVVFLGVINLSLVASESPRAIFDEAIKLKSESLKSMADRDSYESKARELFVKAAELFEADAQDNWRDWYEAGNARWWAGQAEKAILDYRRYLLRDGFRGEAWENLAQARLKAGTTAPGREGFLIWPWFLYFAAAAAFLFGGAVLSIGINIYTRNARWRKSALAFGLAAICLAMASAGSMAARGQMAIVITETQGRKGDASVYSPWPASPWKAGQEAWITEVRDTWTRIRVGDTVSWVPSSALIELAD